jgi:uncharacterized protein (TIGR03435 family)
MTNAFFRGAVVLLLAAGVDYGQGVTRPSFEVGSVKPAEPLRFDDEVDLFRQLYNAVKIDPAQVRLTNQTLEYLISSAYRVKTFQISAPAWISSARYDISAKIPDGVTTDLVPEMLQSLLEDRLKLKCHRDSKELDVFVLSVGEGGLKIPQKPADYKFSATAAAWPQKMESLANDLTRAVGRPVMDETGLPGEYMVPRDFRDSVSRAYIGSLHLPSSAAPEGVAAAPSAGDIRLSIQTLGLSLRPGKQSFPLLVVDHAEKTPTEN